MLKDPGQLDVRLLILPVAIILLAIVVGISITKLPPLAPAIVIVGIIVCLITLVRTDFGLIILLFSMLLSPELTFGEVTPYRAVMIRVDDILLAVVFFTWLAKLAVRKELGLLKHTPINLPIMAYIGVCLLFTGKGIMTGDVSSPIGSAFYLLKYIEYFLLFFMFSNNIRSQRQMKGFMVAFLITAVIICIYGFTQIGRLGRTTAPFEMTPRGGEPNTLAGYLLLVFGVCAGLFLYNDSPTRGVILGALIFLIMPAFLFSLSRGGYVGFICLYLTLIILSRKKKLLLISIFVLGILFAPLILPDRVMERITTTFIPGKEYEVFGGTLALEMSAAQRIDVWKWIFGKWQERPLFGYGVTGVGFVDNQYARTLGEVGAIGFLIFVWLMMSIFRNGLRIFRTVEDNYFKGLSLGFLAGFVGILVQGFTGNIFIIVRIMEPFYFLAAVVMALPELATEEVTTEEAEAKIEKDIV